MVSLTHRLVALLQLAFVLVVILILLVYVFYGFKGRKYSREFEKLYDKLDGENPEYAREALAAADKEPEERKDAEYYYRRGVILQHNLHDIPAATRCFEKALSLLNKELGPMNNNHMFITDRIADNARNARNTRLFTTAQTVGENQLNQQLQLLLIAGDLDQGANTSDKVKLIEKAKTYTSDSQNVHDSALNQYLFEQYKKIERYNQDEGLNLSIEHFKPSKNNKRINYVLDVIKSNGNKTSLLGVTEYQLLNAVWNRIHSKHNKENREKMIEALEDQLNECATSDSSTVCVAGRCSHVISSLALLDKDPTIGVLKTKEVLRNELLNEAAKIVEKYTGKTSSVSQNIIDDYMSSNDTPQVRALKQQMADEITRLAPNYESQLPKNQVDVLIEQCLAVI
jgi:hypothetical protein